MAAEEGIHNVGRHFAVSGPLSSTDGEQARVRDADNVITEQVLGIRGMGVGGKRTDSGPGCHDILTSNSDGGVASNSAQNEVDFLFSGLRLSGDLAGLVGGTGDDLSLPRDEEDNTAIFSLGDDHTHLNRGVVVRKDDVSSGRGGDHLGNGLVSILVAEGVDKGAGRIDDRLGLDVPLFSSNLVTDSSSTNALLEDFFEARLRNGLNDFGRGGGSGFSGLGGGIRIVGSRSGRLRKQRRELDDLFDRLVEQIDDFNMVCNRGSIGGSSHR